MSALCPCHYTFLRSSSKTNILCESAVAAYLSLLHTSTSFQRNHLKRRIAYYVRQPTHSVGNVHDALLVTRQIKVVLRRSGSCVLQDSTNKSLPILPRAFQRLLIACSLYAGVTTANILYTTTTTFGRLWLHTVLVCHEPAVLTLMRCCQTCSKDNAVSTK